METKRREQQLLTIVLLTIFLICLLDHPHTTSAQRCKKYVNNTGFDICTPYVTYDYFLSEGPTEWTVEALLYHTAYTTTAGITLTPGSCEQKLQAYACASIFNRCEKTDKGDAPRSVCRSLCEDVVDACGDYFAANPTAGALPNCTANPESHSTYTFSSGATKELKCFVVDDEIPPPKFPYECGGPYAYNEEGEELYGFPCTLKCPTPIIPKELISRVDWVLRFLIPFVILINGSILAMQFYRWRIWCKWPRVWICADGIAKITPPISVMFVIVVGGLEDIGCWSKSRAVEADYWLAKAQTWVLFIGAWSSSIGYAIISSNVLLLTLRPPWLKKVLIYINIFDFCAMFLFPTVIMIVLESLGLTGYCSGFGTCFFATDVPVGAVDNGLILLILVIPYSVAQLWAYLCLIVVIYLVFRSGGFPALLKQIRIVGFLLVFGVAFTISLIYPYKVLIGGTEGLTEYITCETTNWIGSLFSSHYQDVSCHLEERRPFSTFDWQYGLYNAWIDSLIWCLFFCRESVTLFLYGEHHHDKKKRGVGGISGLSITPGKGRDSNTGIAASASNNSLHSIHSSSS